MRANHPLSLLACVTQVVSSQLRSAALGCLDCLIRQEALLPALCKLRAPQMLMALARNEGGRVEER